MAYAQVDGNRETFGDVIKYKDIPTIGWVPSNVKVSKAKFLDRSRDVDAIEINVDGYGFARHRNTV